MTTTMEDNGVRTYTARVAEQLDDLPEAERRDLLEDLEQHLLEVAAEADGDLIERLGPPEAYATDLRASAGIPPRGEPPEQGLLERLAGMLSRSRPVRSARALASTRTARAIRDFVPELRPGWWVLRGYLTVVAVAILWGEFSAYPLGRVLLPRVYGPLVGLALIAMGIWASVALGRRAPSSTPLRRLSAIISIGVIVIAGAALRHLDDGLIPIQALSGAEQSYPAFLQHADGSPITNICPFAADGSPLSGVLLFDQSGRPIEEVAPPEEVYGKPSTEDVAPQPSVAVVPNAYPRPQRVADPATGLSMEFHCPPAVAGHAGGTGG